MYTRFLATLSLLFVAAAAPLLAAQPAAAQTAADAGWVVSAEQAKALIDAEQATVLDTRGEVDWKRGHVPGALPVKWQDFSRSKAPHGGKLLADEAALSDKLQRLGVSKSRAVLVVGKPPQNWGEDGRIVWMLRTLGHPRAALVDGGHDALEKAGLEMKKERPEVARGDFEAKLTGQYAIERDTLRAKLTSDEYVFVDTREPREFNGKTPYGEARGGHLPGAKHLHYTELMRPDGRLLPKPALREKLRRAGITPDKQVVAYCTGGVRSAWVVAVLAHLGYPDAMNYAGSMWDWAAGDAADYPLVSGD